MACGIDTGDSTSLVRVCSQPGELVERFEFDRNSEGYEEALRRVPMKARITYEATLMTYPLARALEEFGHSVTRLPWPTVRTGLGRVELVRESYMDHA